MRNLKRVLALALALVMVIGMMVMGASAAEATEYDYAEAQAIVTGTAIFEGDNTGAMDWEGTLTREMAAKIMAYIKLGKATADKLVAKTQNFTDVANDRWSAGYIASCADTGLIAGRGDGTFDPEGELTALAFAKLLLVAQGYDADAEGYVGANWSTAIAIDAMKEGLDLDEVTLYDTVNRQQAAQMILQILDNEMVGYAKIFDKSTASEILVFDGYQGVTFGWNYLRVYCVDDYNDSWGRPVDHAWVHATKGTLYEEWETPVAKYQVATAECQLATDLKLNGNTEYPVDIYNNGVLGSVAINPVDTVNKVGAQGVQLEVYADRIVRIDTYLAEVTAKTTALQDAAGHTIRTASNSFSAYLTGTTPAAGAVAGNAYEVGDMILVNYNAAKAAYTALGLAETVNGTQTFVWWNADKHTVAGVDYNDNVHFYLDAAGIDLTKGYTWYLDQFGNMIGNSAIVTPKAYGIVENVQWLNTWGVNGYAQATIRYMDNTTATKVISDVTVGTTTAYMTYADYSELTVGAPVAPVTTNADFLAGKISTVWQYNDDCMDHLFEIVENANGTISLIAQAELTAADVKDGISAVVGTGTPTTIYTDNYTTYLIRTETLTGYAYSFVTGYDNLENDWTGADVVVDYVMNNSTGYAKYVYLTGSADTAAAVSANKFLYITSTTRYYGDALQNGVPCFVIGGVVGTDGAQTAIYVAQNAETTAAATQIALNTLLASGTDKLYLVKTTNGIVIDVDNIVAVAVDGSDVSDGNTKPAQYATYSGKGTFSTVDGNGVLMIHSGASTMDAINVNASTTIINQGGVGTVTDLKNAVLAGKSIYVVGKMNAAGNGVTTDAVAVFITGYAPAAPAVEAVTVKSASTGGTCQFDTLAAAVAAASAGDEIILNADVTLTAQLTLGAAVTLNGNGHTITANGYKSATAGENGGILVNAAATIKNLTVVGPNTLVGWDSGEYGIKVYAAGAVLENVTVTGANAGIQVAANTTLKGTINVSGNEFGGIEVKNSAVLTIASGAVIVNTTESATVPSVWMDREFDGTVSGGALTAKLMSDKKIYYFVNAANAAV